MKSCSFFGHRKIEEDEGLKQKVRGIVERLIVEEDVTTFLFGSRSDFDALCHLVVTELKEKYMDIKRIAYTCRHETCVLESERQRWEKIHSHFKKREVHLLGVEEEYQHITKYTSGRASYIERNEAMIDCSDFCVFFYDEKYRPELRKRSNGGVYYQPKSGTKLAYEYARRKKKIIINVRQ